MKIGILIPDRNDRPVFLRNCLRMMNGQTLKPEKILLMDEPARDEKVDIGWRYKTGYELLRNKNLDAIAFIENDDWYAPNYLQVAAAAWKQFGNPILLGQTSTIYYSLRVKKYFVFHHGQRSSAMNTLIKPDMTGIDWGGEDDPYTDLHLWHKLGGCDGANLTDKRLYTPETPTCIGMKHGVGKVGGMYHSSDFERYEHDDNGFLERIVKPVDPMSYDFYMNLKIN